MGREGGVDVGMAEIGGNLRSPLTLFGLRLFGNFKARAEGRGVQACSRKRGVGSEFPRETAGEKDIMRVFGNLGIGSKLWGNVWNQRKKKQKN